ncbi:MAG: hypothetical protein F6K09_09005 [Merismopedia sp. SIO2A8]|nr:hypothetical protein [Symploca sp. SIO2B6]NET48848.1 hypothetical protein [Merismopedia sp. SIO2A8]
MIISDQHYLEVVSQASKSIRGGVFDVDVDTDLDTDVSIDIDKDIDCYLCYNPPFEDPHLDCPYYPWVMIRGNFASVTGDATAIGNNTPAEIDFTITVTDDIAEVTAIGYVAVE